MFPEERVKERERLYGELENHPKKPKLWLAYGDFLEQEWRDYRTAILIWKKLQKLVPQWDWRPRLGAAYSRAGEHEKGINLIKVSLRSHTSELGYCNLGQAYLRTGKYKLAQDAFRQLLVLNPKNEEGHFLLGKALWKSGATEKGYDCFQEAIRLDPKYPEAWFWIGFYLSQKTEDSEGALYAFKKAVEFEPTYGQAKQIMAVILDQLDRFEEAETYFKESIQEFPEIANFHQEYAKFLKKRGRHEEAKAFNRNARELKNGYKTIRHAGHLVDLTHLDLTST